ncbi:MAG: SCO family protein [Acidimicrobiales bacterium]
MPRSPRFGPSSPVVRALVVAVLAGGAALCACSSGPAVPGPPSPSLGVVQDRAVPSIPLVDQHGTPTTLASFRGRTVVLAPMLTLCAEECPLTTENLLQIQRAIDGAGLSRHVVVVEYSVDPGRDTPARLTAYAKLTGVPWTLLTGTQSNVDAMNSFFYVSAQPAPEGSPPQVDWWTHQPLTYDVVHTDGYIVIDPSGHERFATSAEPEVTGHTLPAALDRLLDVQGQQYLNDPSINGQTWTVAQALSVVGWVAHQAIPTAS